MKRADRNKNDFKKKVSKWFDDYHYFIMAGMLTLSVAFVGFMWQKFDNSIPAEFNIEAVLEDKAGEYTGAITHNESGESFITVSGDLDDSDLIILQRAVVERENVQLPIYLLEEDANISRLIPFYDSSLIKRGEWLDSDVHEIVSFVSLPSIKPDVTTIPDWEINEESTRYEDNLFIVEGEIFTSASDLEVLTQMRGLAEMIDDLNKDNSDANYKDLLIHLESAPADLYYHTNYKSILGKGDVYRINSENKEPTETAENLN